MFNVYPVNSNKSQTVNALRTRNVIMVKELE